MAKRKARAESRGAVSSACSHAPHVSWRRVDEEAVILNLETSDYYSLNPVASDVWEALGKKKNITEIVVSISKKYGTPIKRVEQDVDELLAALRKEKLLA